MSEKKPFEPNFQTPQEDLCKEELNKLNAPAVHKQFFDQIRDDSVEDYVWEVEQIAKSSGIYLEFDRSIKDAKNWTCMIRIANPGGGPINREQWNLLDELSDKYAVNPHTNLPSIRLTNRQTVQFHWVTKAGVRDVVKSVAEKGLNSLNGCGDNTRNVMAPPMSRFSTVFNAIEWSHKIGNYFQLPMEPWMTVFGIDPDKVRVPGESFAYPKNLLNRKFKIALGAFIQDAQTGKLVADNAAELRSNDLGISPILNGNKVEKVQIYVGGGQGERNGKPSTAALGQALCIVELNKLLEVADAIVKVHAEFGDRQNRHWARLKYVIKKMGIEWYRDQVSAKLGYPLEKADPHHDIGDRQLYFGWNKQENSDLLSYGMYIENGRVIDDGPNGQLKSLVRHIINTYDVELMITPNQDLLFNNIPAAQKDAFEATLKEFHYGQRNGKAYSTLRMHSGACVGRDTCRLTYTDSEKFEPELIDELENLGWNDIPESIGITGCERQCFRPATKTIGLIGTGLNRYQFKLMGDETGRFQGVPLIDSSGENMYLRSVAREDVAKIIDILFKFYKDNAQDGESLGAYHRRVGADAIIAHLKNNPISSAYMEKPFNTATIID